MAEHRSLLQLFLLRCKSLRPGAINMVDDLYSGSFANVLVTNNTITGEKLFNAGIAIGAFAWFSR
jgi:hypothetical protein